ncbi:hypothetical protein Dip518_000923 [Parelusimicrobium proximum]|uniref:hypothetical protein n=1 Tax=Parelusimicrobium proximum TaxID=3228953 RepID=UPI003D186038
MKKILVFAVCVLIPLSAYSQRDSGFTVPTKEQFFYENLFKKDVQGRTVLHLAENSETAKALIAETKADNDKALIGELMSVKDNLGMTPVQTAVLLGHFETAVFYAEYSKLEQSHLRAIASASNAYRLNNEHLASIDALLKKYAGALGPDFHKDWEALLVTAQKDEVKKLIIHHLIYSDDEFLYYHKPELINNHVLRTPLQDYAGKEFDEFKEYFHKKYPDFMSLQKIKARY